MNTFRIIFSYDWNCTAKWSTKMMKCNLHASLKLLESSEVLNSFWKMGKLRKQCLNGTRSGPLRKLFIPKRKCKYSMCANTNHPFVTRLFRGNMHVSPDKLTLISNITTAVENVAVRMPLVILFRCHLEYLVLFRFWYIGFVHTHESPRMTGGPRVCSPGRCGPIYLKCILSHFLM